jgi:anti-sigma28 factor (negative regulator of flagellin synthesis)
MKNTTSGPKRSVSFSGNLASTRRMLRRDLTLRNEEKLPDLKSAKNMAEQLEILERYIAKAPYEDIQLRNRIRNAIVTGEYMIDPRSIAEKFLRFEDELYL